MKRKIVAVGALLMVLAGGYAVQAGPMGAGCRNHQNGMGQPGCRTQMNCREEGRCLDHFQRMADTLGLSERQRQDIEAVLKGQEEGHAQLMEKIAEGRRQLMEASRSSDMDEAKVAELAEEQGRLMSEMMVSQVQVKKQIFALLTPEQQQKADAFCDGCAGGTGCRGPWSGPGEGGAVAPRK